MQVRPFDNMEARGSGAHHRRRAKLFCIVDEPVAEMVRQGGGTVAYPGLTSE